MAANVEVVITAQDNFSSTLGNFGNIMTGIKSTIDLVAGAFNAVVDFGSQFVNAAMEGESAVAELDAVLQSTGFAAGLTSQELQDMATEISHVTAFSDEAVMSGQSMLLTFKNIGEDVFPRATDAMVDMAQMFGSMDAASMQLGKALNDPIAGLGALSRIGIKFTDEQKELVAGFMAVNDIASAQGVILQEIEGQIEKVAEAYGKTFAGQLEIFKNRIGEVKETIGAGLLPILATLLDKFNTNFMPVLETLGERIGDVFKTLNVGLTEGNWEFFFGSLERLDIFVGDFFQKIADEIDKWVAGGGPQELTEKAIAWIEDLGSDSVSQSRIVTAVGNIFNALKTALGDVEWSKIALVLDEKIGAAIDSHEWGVSGQNFGRSIEQQFVAWLEGDTATGPSSDIVTALGNAIGDWFLGAMDQPDWETAGRTFIEILKQFVFQPIGDWIKNNWITILFPAIPTDAAREKMVPIIDGIKQGFIDQLNAIDLGAQKWVDDHIINPIKRALGISSPSTVFMQIGRDIIGGLLAGITSMSSTIINGFENLLDDILSLPGFQQIADALGIGGGSIGGATGDATGLLGGGTGTTGSGVPGIPPPGGSLPGTGGGMVVNQYFSGATINVGSWEQIAYDCMYPNPFVTATSGQLGSSGGGVTGR